MGVTSTVPRLGTTNHKKSQLTILNMRPINTRYSKAAMMLVTKSVLSVLFNNAVHCYVHTASMIRVIERGTWVE
jgi:hypothetical protein